MEHRREGLSIGHRRAAELRVGALLPFGTGLPSPAELRFSTFIHHRARSQRGCAVVLHRCPDGAAGRIRCRELRVACFQIAQLVNEAVVVVIRHERIGPGMVGNLRAGQRGGNLIPTAAGLVNAHAPIVPHHPVTSNPQRAAGHPIVV